jgi:hypothetical protein
MMYVTAGSRAFRHRDRAGEPALTLADVGERDQARRLLEQVLQVWRRVLGAEHPDTLAAQSNLATTLQSLGERRSPSGR